MKILKIRTTGLGIGLGIKLSTPELRSSDKMDGVCPF
jgi:hypothetical protein